MNTRDLIGSFFLLVLVLFISSCSGNRRAEELTPMAGSGVLPDSQIYLLRDTTVQLVRRKDKSPEAGSALLVNRDYIDTMSDPERAAIEYLSLVSLEQGFTAEKMNFLKRWFRYDQKSLGKLDLCPRSCNNRKTFEEVNLTVKADTITVRLIAAESVPGGLMRWMQEDTFRLEEDHIKLAEEKRIPLHS